MSPSRLGNVLYPKRSAAAAGASVSRCNSTRCGGRTIKGSAISPRSPDWPRRRAVKGPRPSASTRCTCCFPASASAPVPINRLTAGSSTRSIWMFRRTLRPASARRKESRIPRSGRTSARSWNAVSSRFRPMRPKPRHSIVSFTTVAASFGGSRCFRPSPRRGQAKPGTIGPLTCALRTARR